MMRQERHKLQRDLHVGDIVLVRVQSQIKKYLLAVVEEVNLNKDGIVRSCMVKYIQCPQS